MTPLPPRLPIRPTSLPVWAGMLAMQPRVWLPENLESVASRREIILTTALSGLFCSASVLWMTGLKEGPVFWVVALLCTAQGDLDYQFVGTAIRGDAAANTLTALIHHFLKGMFHFYSPFY